jgi:hypothetical protein
MIKLSEKFQFGITDTETFKAQNYQRSETVLIEKEFNATTNVMNCILMHKHMQFLDACVNFLCYLSQYFEILEVLMQFTNCLQMFVKLNHFFREVLV